MSGTVLVPLDGSHEAEAAVPVAKMLAGLLDASTQTLHVDPPEDPADGILFNATHRHSVAIVVCSHTGAAGIVNGLGPVASQLLQRSPCPLVFVPPGRGRARWRLKRILLPFDGTPATAWALGQLAPLAHRTGASIEVVHVVGPGVNVPAERGAITAPRYIDQPQHEWPSWTHEFLERVACLGHLSLPQLRLSMRMGEPAHEIAILSQRPDVDLLVLVWHGRLEPHRAAVLRRVLKATACPVMVLKIDACSAGL